MNARAIHVAMVGNAAKGSLGRTVVLVRLGMKEPTVSMAVSWHIMKASMRHSTNLLW